MELLLKETVMKPGAKLFPTLFALCSVESRYPQTDIEGLALVWVIEHFRFFLLGTEFDVVTDHKELEAIFSIPKSKPPSGLERWISRLQPYNFGVFFIKSDYQMELII